MSLACLKINFVSTLLLLRAIDEMWAGCFGYVSNNKTSHKIVQESRQSNMM